MAGIQEIGWWDWSWAIWEWLKAFDKWLDWASTIDKAWNDAVRAFWTYEAKTTEDFSTMLTKMDRERDEFVWNIMDQDDALMESFKKNWTGPQLWDWWKSIFGWDDDTTWWGWSSKKWKSQAEKDMENRVKQMKKDLEDLKKQDAENLKALDQLARQELGIIEDNISDINKK